MGFLFAWMGSLMFWVGYGALTLVIGTMLTRALMPNVMRIFRGDYERRDKDGDWVIIDDKSHDRKYIYLSDMIAAVVGLFIFWPVVLPIVLGWWFLKIVVYKMIVVSTLIVFSKIVKHVDKVIPNISVVKEDED